MSGSFLLVKLLLGALGAIFAVLLLSLMYGDPALRAVPVLTVSAVTGALGLLVALRVYGMHAAIQMPALLMAILAVLVYCVGIFAGFAVARLGLF